MKKWKKLLVLLLCIMMVQTPALHLVQPQTVEAAAVKAAKKGLKKEKGKYYYYDNNGKRVKNKWINITRKQGGKKVVDRYYFGSNCAAYTGKNQYGMNTPALKKIKGKTYAFGYNGKMLKGTIVISTLKNGKEETKFYYMNKKNGVYNKTQTSKIRRAFGYQKDATALLKLLGRAKKTETMDSCFGDGKDMMLHYDNLILSLYRDTKGKKIILGATCPTI